MQEAQIIPRATTSRPWAKEEPLTVKLKRPRVYAELWQHFLSAYSGSYTCHPPKLTLVTSIYSTQEGTEAQRSSATRLRGRRATMWRWERELRCVPCPPPGAIHLSWPPATFPGRTGTQAGSSGFREEGYVGQTEHSGRSTAVGSGGVGGGMGNIAVEGVGEESRSATMTTQPGFPEASGSL